MVMVFILLFVSSASAAYQCSNGVKIEKEQEDIRVGYAAGVNGLGIGVFNSLRHYGRDRFEAEILIEGKRVTLDSNNPEEELRFSDDDKVLIELISAVEDNVTLKIDNSSIEIAEGESEDQGGYTIYLSKVYTGEDKIDLIIGSDKILLTSDEGYETTIKNNTYLIELSYADLDDVLINVYKCLNTDIIKVEDPLPTPAPTNITPPNTTLATTPNATTNTTVNNGVGSTVNTTGNDTITTTKKEIGFSCTTNDECSSDLCHRDKCVKKYFFDKILAWFKNLF